MTNEQINEVLAKWHSENDHDNVRYEYSHGAILRNIAPLRTQFETPYTDSLDTVRLIEDLLTEKQWYRYAEVITEFLRNPQVPDFLPNVLKLHAETRARALVKVLGLEENE